VHAGKFLSDYEFALTLSFCKIEVARNIISESACARSGSTIAPCNSNTNTVLLASSSGTASISQASRIRRVEMWTKAPLRRDLGQLSPKIAYDTLLIHKIPPMRHVARGIRLTRRLHTRARRFASCEKMIS